LKTGRAAGRAAIADLDQAVRLDPADAMSVFNRGGARENLCDFEGAVADYELALRVDSAGRWSSQIRESLNRARQRLGGDR